MKKFFSVFAAAALIALSFTACDKKGGNEPDQPKPADSTDVVTFTIDVTDVTANSATITVQPSVDTVWYYWSIVDARYLAQFTADQIAELLMKDEVEEYESTFESLVEDGYALQGEDVYTYTQLEPETEYAVVAFAIDQQLNVASPAATKNFTTDKLVITDSVTVSVDDAMLTDYTAYGMLQVAAIDEENTKAQYAVTFVTAELEGTFTTDDLQPRYSGIAYSETEVYSIVRIECTGALNADSTVYTLAGTMDGSNGIRYNFTFAAPVEEEEEPAEAPAKRQTRLALRR